MKEELPFANMSPRMDDERILIEEPDVNVMIRETAGEVDDSPPVVQAHRFAQRAEKATRLADFALAADLHLKSAKAFLMATELVRDHGVLASALLLLADSHAARAEEATVRQRISKNGQLSSSSRSGVASVTDRGVLLAGGDRARQAPAVATDMEDSIMRGPAAYNEGGSSSSAAANASTVAAEELVKKFRPQRDDLLELERQLAKLGLESKAGGVGGRARHRTGANPGAHLSSALGESFCLLNQSVIIGGGVGIGGGGLNDRGYGGSASVLPRKQDHPRQVQSTTHATVPGPAEGKFSTADGGVGDGGGEKIRYRTTENDEVAQQAAGMQGGSSADPDSSVANVGGRGSREDTRRGPDGVFDRDARRGSGESAAGAAGAHEARRFSTSGEGRNDLRREDEEETHQGEIMRLLTCLKTLGDENVSLMKECEDRDRVRQESEATREEMRRFQTKYQERFTLLKKTLDEVVRSYPLLAGAGAAVGPNASAGGIEGARATEEVQRLTQANRKLTAQVKKYERYYLELCQKAEIKRKEQLAQPKTARQLQQQQQQQQQQMRRQPTPPGLRRPQGQHVIQGPVGGAAATAATAPPHQYPQGPLVPRRSSSAPESQPQQQQPQLQRKQAGAAPGGTPQTVPAFAQQQQQQQQQLRQNQPKPTQRRNQHQQLRQPQQPLGRPGSGSGGVLGSYRGNSGPQAPAAAVVRGGLTSVASAGHGGGVVHRSAGLDDESEV